MPSYASCLRDKPSAGQRASQDAACGVAACDGYDADRARNDDAAADGELDVESGMDTPQLEKAAPERASGKTDRREFWKE